jgi:hypothetical protein
LRRFDSGGMDCHKSASLADENGKPCRVRQGGLLPIRRIVADYWRHALC